MFFQYFQIGTRIDPDAIAILDNFMAGGVVQHHIGYGIPQFQSHVASPALDPFGSKGSKLLTSRQVSGRRVLRCCSTPCARVGVLDPVGRTSRAWQGAGLTIESMWIYLSSKRQPANNASIHQKTELASLEYDNGSFCVCNHPKHVWNIMELYGPPFSA